MSTKVYGASYDMDEWPDNDPADRDLDDARREAEAERRSRYVDEDDDCGCADPGCPCSGLKWTGSP